MKPYLIREANINDLYKALIVLYRSFGRSVPPDLKDQEKLLTNLVKSKIAKFIVGEKEKKIFGFGGLFIFEDVCSIGYMAVLPELRLKGVGTTIFSKLISEAKKTGCKTFMLYASKLGEPIYHKFGFRSNYNAIAYDLPTKLPETQTLNENVKIVKNFPDWTFKIDRKAIGFDRREFLNIKLHHGSKLIIVDKEGYALISGLRIGPLIAKNLHTAVNLIKTGVSLGANHIIVPKHSELPYRLFDMIKITERVDEVNLKMIYGKNIIQKLDYFYALGTYAKG